MKARLRFLSKIAYSYGKQFSRYINIIVVLTKHYHAYAFFYLLLNGWRCVWALTSLVRQCECASPLHSTSIVISVNPFMPNGISCHHLDESISNLTVVEW